MSEMRHGLIRHYDPKPGVCVTTLAYEYPPEFHVPPHAHGSHQLIYATRGLMEVSAGQSYWLIPPQFAVWIPAGTMHQIRMSGAVSMRTLYLRPSAASGLPNACTVLYVAPLLRELVVEAVRLGRLRVKNRLHCALRDLIISQLKAASPVPTSVVLPQDPRALRVATACIAQPGGSMDLRHLCESAGVSVRTIERAFRKDVGMTFDAWRRQVRLMKAIELLAKGNPVKEIAYEVGYAQPSAFVAMFRQALGTTPKAWAVAVARS